MNWRLAVGIIIVIIILLILGPEGTANALKGLGSWLGRFINSL